MSPKSQPFINQMLAMSWLGQDQVAGNVLFNVNNIIQAQALLKKHLPNSISLACTVVKISDNIITIGVPSPAYASKTKQLAPSIIKILHEGGYNINQVSLKILNSLTNQTTLPKPRNVQAIDDYALTHFKQLQENLPAGPLADAIDRLYNRHKNV